MKKYDGILWFTIDKRFHKVYHSEDFCVPSCSWRRAKKLASKLGCYRQGTRRRNNPKWRGRDWRLTYNRKRKVLWLNRCRRIVEEAVYDYDS